MESRWTHEATLQPPSYDQATGGISEAVIGGNLTFVDFLPHCCDRGGIFKLPKFESFRTLVDRANEWLRTNHRWEAKTCESVEFKLKSSSNVDTQTMTYLEYGERTTFYVRGLRLWIVPNINFSGECQQIGYMNLVPQLIDNPTFFGSPSYESLDSVLERFNSMIAVNPLPGKIINIETQEMKSKSRNFDPDRCSWGEDGEMQKQFLFVFRVFYETTPCTTEFIGVMDFIPEKIKDGGVISNPKYEPFSNVVYKASVWCAQQTMVRVCNVQSLEIKVKRGREINRQKMSYSESGSVTTYYIRILRVAYTMTQNTTAEYRTANQQRVIHQLTCKTFIPVQLDNGYFLPKFETLDNTKMRLEAWVRATGVQVISAETAAIRLFTGGEAKYGTEATFTYNRSERNEYWIFVIRLYLNGFYREPPVEVLPAVPQIQESECCVLL